MPRASAPATEEATTEEATEETTTTTTKTGKGKARVVSSATMMELYEAAVKNKMTYKELLFEVKASGSYASTDQAADRLHRFKSYVRKKYDCELQALAGTPRLTSNRAALMKNYSCLVKR